MLGTFIVNIYIKKQAVKPHLTSKKKKKKMVVS